MNTLHEFSTRTFETLKRFFKTPRRFTSNASMFLKNIAIFFQKTAIFLERTVSYFSEFLHLPIEMTPGMKSRMKIYPVRSVRFRTLIVRNRTLLYTP